MHENTLWVSCEPVDKVNVNVAKERRSNQTWGATYPTHKRICTIGVISREANFCMLHCFVLWDLCLPINIDLYIFSKHTINEIIFLPKLSHYSFDLLTFYVFHSLIVAQRTSKLRT